MLRAALRRLCSTALMLVVAGGGGGLPLIDGLFYHSNDQDGLRAHYESASGCHADRCALRSTAHESRGLPVLLPPVQALIVPPSPLALRQTEPLGSRLLSGRPLSRAPPLFG